MTAKKSRNNKNMSICMIASFQDITQKSQQKVKKLTTMAKTEW
jgi:hypothetical protein